MKFLLVMGMLTSATLFAGLEGTYSIDKESVLKAIDQGIEMQVSQAAEDQKAQVRSSAEAMKPMLVNVIQTLEIQFVIKGDGTVSYSAKSPDGQTDEGTGTWVLEGDKITFSSDKEGQESFTGMLKDGDIHMQIPNMPMALVFVKQ